MIDYLIAKEILGATHGIGLLLRICLIFALVVIAKRKLQHKGIKSWYLASCLFGSFVALFSILIVYPFYSGMKNLGNHQQISFWQSFEHFKKEKGRWPDTLPEICSWEQKLVEKKKIYGLAYIYLTRYCRDKGDAWGTPVFYERKGEAYIIASYGSDMKPDGIDYWELRKQNIRISNCSYPSMDIVISDKDNHIWCGK